MSDDLISRKATYKDISDYLNRSRLGETSAQTDLRVGEIASIIHGVPAAFDKEKVIEKLEDLKDIPHDDSVEENISTKIWNKAIQKAIAIVEKGGIE